MIAEFVRCSVPNFQQDQSAGGRCETGERAVPLEEERSKIVQTDRSSADLEQGARHVANHMVQESVSLDRQEQPAGLRSKL